MHSKLKSQSYSECISTQYYFWGDKPYRSVPKSLVVFASTSKLAIIISLNRAFTSLSLSMSITFMKRLPFYWPLADVGRLVAVPPLLFFSVAPARTCRGRRDHFSRGFDTQKRYPYLSIASVFFCYVPICFPPFVVAKVDGTQKTPYFSEVWHEIAMVAAVSFPLPKEARQSGSQDFRAEQIQ